MTDPVLLAPATIGVRAGMVGGGEYLTDKSSGLSCSGSFMAREDPGARMLGRQRLVIVVATVAKY